MPHTRSYTDAARYPSQSTLHSADMDPNVDSIGILPALLDHAPKISSSHRRTPTDRSIPSLHRASSNTRPKRSFSGSHFTTRMSARDYESLPSSVKKKFFSSAERLHIAQQSSIDSRRRKHSFSGASGTTSSISTDHNVRPSTSGGIGLRRMHSRRQSKEPQSTFAGLDLDDISEEQARWYLGLPEKIRKQHFSRKEQISLAVRCKRVLEISSPTTAQDVLRRCLNGGREEELSYHATHRRRRSSTATVDTDILIDEEYMDSAAAKGVEADDIADDLEMFHFNARQPIRQPRHHMSHPSLSSSPIPEIVPISNPSKRRSYSHLTPMSLPPPQLSPVPPVPALPPAFQYTRVATGTPPQPTGPKADILDASVDSKHYQQLDVRKQLRQYLTPEKFDEALEFGFSFSPEGHAPSSSATNQSFLQHQPPPLYHPDDDYGEEDSSDSLETTGPRTPTTVSEHAYTTIKPASFDSNGELSLRQNFLSSLKAVKTRTPSDTLGGNREMTIHMTLTRRDLRGPVEESSFGVSRPQTSGGAVEVERVDPLALQSLPVCDDPSGAQGAFAVRPARSAKGFKKVWKTLIRH